MYRVTVSLFAGGTWLESEDAAYPAGGFTREGRAVVGRNDHNPIELPYGEIRAVRASIPDTHFSIPARMRVRGRTVHGYLSFPYGFPEGVLMFIPDADPDRCRVCVAGYGCRREARGHA